jgi:hypothetical protein
VTRSLSLWEWIKPREARVRAAFDLGATVASEQALTPALCQRERERATEREFPGEGLL